MHGALPVDTIFCYHNDVLLRRSLDRGLNSSISQVTVWGDYGRIEGRKVFMGVAQIMLDDLDLSNIVIGWYKLYGTSSLVGYSLL